MDISWSLLGVNFSLLNDQENFKGWSPPDTEQVADIDSPEFAGRSPNEKATICGATVEMVFKRLYLFIFWLSLCALNFLHTFNEFDEIAFNGREIKEGQNRIE